jgi:hypothetical protein
MKKETKMKLNDFANMVNVIDICTERGAFKGNELLTVGSLREKLAEFVKANQPAEPVEAPVEDQDEAEYVEDTEAEYTE